MLKIKMRILICFLNIFLISLAFLNNIFNNKETEVLSLSFVTTGFSKKKLELQERIKEENAERKIESNSHDLNTLSKNGSEYKLFKLKNLTTVILTSVPNLEKCEISIINQVGSILEPKEIQGLAFYLMNVLLLSPNSNKNINLHDFSMDNSGTFFYDISLTYSDYNLLISSKHFNEALKLFSGMFSNPIINDEILEKALNLMDSSIYSCNKKKLLLDIFYLKFSSPLHPSSRNVFGNSNNLKIIPESKGVDMKSELLKFFQREYSSNRLILSLKCGLSIEQMEDLVVNLFGNIPNKNLPTPSTQKPFNIIVQNPLFNSTKKVFYSSNNEQNVLYLTFPSKNYLLPYSRSDPLFLFRELIYLQKGSLLDYLKKNGLVNRINLGIQNNLYGFSNFEFTIYLSNEGVFNLPHILKSFFGAITAIRNYEFNQDYYKSVKEENLKRIDSSEFKFFDFESIYLINNYYRLGLQNINSLLLGIHDFQSFDLNLHKQIISEISPENLIISLFTTNDYSNNEKGFSSFNSTLNSRNCTSYYQLLDKKDFFHCQYLTNIPGDINEKIENIHNIDFFMADFHPCLVDYLSKLSQEYVNEIKVTLQKTQIVNQVSTNSYREVEKMSLPKMLKEILDVKDTKHFHNYRQFQNFYYYIPHKMPCNQIFILINFLYPFNKKKMSSIPSIKAYTLLFLLREAIKFFSNKNFGFQGAKLTPIIFLPQDSLYNSFGFNVTLEGYPQYLPSIISNFGDLIRQIINIDLSIFKDFINTCKNYLEFFMNSDPENHDYLNFINSINLTHDITTEMILQQLLQLQLEDLSEFASEVFILSEIFGIAYGNLTPNDAAGHLNQLFDVLNRSQKDNLVSNIKNISHKTLRRTRKKTTRLLTKMRTKSKKKSKLIKTRINITDRKTKKFSTKLNKTRKNDATKQEKFNEALPSINKLYNFISTKYSKVKSNHVNKIQLIDFSSIETGTKLYYQVNSRKLKKNKSILWILIDKTTSESYVFSDFLKYILQNQISNYRTSDKNFQISLKDYFISNNSIFISLVGVSVDRSISEVNNQLLEYWNKFFSPNSPILNESLFNLLKKNLINVFVEQSLNDELLTNISFEILNARYDFTKFRSKKYLLNQLTFQKFSENVHKVWDRSVLILFSIKKHQDKSEDSESSITVPNDFTNLVNIKDVFKISGLNTFKPSLTRIEKQRS